MNTANYSLAFEPIELADKLAFLACYSRYVIALQSEHQEQQALELYNASSEVSEVIVLSGSELSPRVSEQYTAVAAAFGLASDRYPDVALGEFVAIQTVRPLVILTGCEQMDDDQLASAYSLVDRTGVGLTLFSKSSLKTRKASLRASHVLHTTVRKLSSRDVKQMLRQRATEEVRVSDSDIQAVIDRSRGNIEKADALVADMVTTEKKNLGLPLAHMSMVVLFLVVVVGGFAAIPREETSLIPAEISVRASPEANRVSTKREDEFALLTQAEKVADPVTPTPVLRAIAEIPEATSPVELAPTATSIIDHEIDVAHETNQAPEAVIGEPVTPQPVQLATRDPNAWINSLPPSAAGKSTFGLTREKQGDWLRNAPGSAYTLQIVGSHDEARIIEFMRQHPDLAEFGYFETEHRNQPWFVLTYGRFDDRDTAVAAIGQLITPLKQQKPWARSVASIR